MDQLVIFISYSSIQFYAQRIEPNCEMLYDLINTVNIRFLSFMLFPYEQLQLCINYLYCCTVHFVESL